MDLPLILFFDVPFGCKSFWTTKPKPKGNRSFFKTLFVSKNVQQEFFVDNTRRNSIFGGIEPTMFFLFFYPRLTRILLKLFFKIDWEPVKFNLAQTKKS